MAAIDKRDIERVWLSIARLTQQLQVQFQDLTAALEANFKRLEESLTKIIEASAQTRQTIPRETHLTRFPPISVEAPPSFSDINDVPKRALVDADRHVQADVSGCVSVSDVQKVSTHRYLPPTSLSAGGTATIWAPSAGKAIRCKRIQVSVDAATRIDLRWGTDAFESYFLPANGSIIVNLIGTNQQGPVDTPLTILSSAAATVTASADGDEV